MSKHNIAHWEYVDVSDGSRMRLFIVRPDHASGPAPAVIVFQEAFGVNEHIRDVAVRIASLGYIAVAPELFHRTAEGFEGDYSDLGKSRPHMEALTHVNLENDIRATQDWLQSDSQTNIHNLAAAGYCMGGKAAFIANSIIPLKAGISYYGSSIPSALADYSATQNAPFLFFWGGNDKHISPEERQAIVHSLRQQGKYFTHVEFSYAEHGFFCEERKSYNAQAAAEAWALQAVFLKHHLSK